MTTSTLLFLTSFDGVEYAVPVSGEVSFGKLTYFHCEATLSADERLLAEEAVLDAWFTAAQGETVDCPDTVRADRMADEMKDGGL